MNTALAIYDALLQAGIADAPARKVVEALEQDMTTLLATKQDLSLINQEFHVLRADFNGLRADFAHLERLTSTKIESLADRMTLQFQNIELRIQASESRVVIRLSVVMTALIALAGSLLALVR